MKNGKYQCKDVPVRPILEFLLGMNGRTATWFDLKDCDNTVRSVVSREFCDEILVRKMESLIRRGLVTGCGCGCRGDYLITECGKDFLDATA